MTEATVDDCHATLGWDHDALEVRCDRGERDLDHDAG